MRPVLSAVWQSGQSRSAGIILYGITQQPTTVHQKNYAVYRYLIVCLSAFIEVMRVQRSAKRVLKVHTVTVLNNSENLKQH